METLSYVQLMERCIALAAENAALKSAIQTHSESVHFCELCGKDDPCSTDDVCMVLNKTPTTDAFLAEVRAISLEDFADVMAESGNYDAANHATKHAHKIRQEAAQ